MIEIYIGWINPSSEILFMKKRFDRIVTGYCEGKKGGDTGKSLLLNNTYIWKHHDTCKLYGAVEDLQQSLALAISEGDIIDGELLYTMKWLHQNIFSLSSYAFMKGDSEHHKMPLTFLAYIEKTIERMKDEIGNAKDFLVYSHRSLLSINEIRIRTREVESRFVGWERSLEMQFYLRGPLSFIPDSMVPSSLYDGGLKEFTESILGRRYLIPSINDHITVLNRLSSYFFWAGRLQGKLLMERGDNSVSEQYWYGRVQEFEIDKVSK